MEKVSYDIWICIQSLLHRVVNSARHRLSFPGVQVFTKIYSFTFCCEIYLLPSVKFKARVLFLKTVLGNGF